MKKMNYLAVAMLSVMSTTVYAAMDNNLTALTDSELSTETGQALFNLSYMAPTDAMNLMRGKTIGGDSVGNVGFYKLGLEGELELNANIRNLQLGCGGTNGPDACDIDIKNLSLSGLPDSYDLNGNPVYANGRPSTSAKLTNPFLEFAIKDPDSASTREVKGFRVSAEGITGLLTAGLTNNSVVSTTDGIQSLSGFMRIAATNGSVTTKETLFGNSADQQLKNAYPGATDDSKPNMIVSLLGTHKRIMSSQPGTPDNHGITVPSMQDVAFNTPNFRVNGSRNTSAVVSGIKLKVEEIPMGKTAVYDGNGNITGYTSVGANNQLYVTYNPILGLAEKAKFQMAEGSKVSNLNLDVTFSQALSMLHNIPLEGTGGYLSLQSQKILWPGAFVKKAGEDYIGDTVSDAGETDLNNMVQSDVAQPGWWMSFDQPVKLGTLKAAEEVDISAALPQVAYLTSKYLQDNPVAVSGSEGLSALVNIPLAKQLIIDLQSYTSDTPVKTTLQNLKLVNQEVRTNCWAGTYC